MIHNLWLCKIQADFGLAQKNIFLDLNFSKFLSIIKCPVSQVLVYLNDCFFYDFWANQNIWMEITIESYNLLVLSHSTLRKRQCSVKNRLNFRPHIWLSLSEYAIKTWKNIKTLTRVVSRCRIVNIAWNNLVTFIVS